MKNKIVKNSSTVDVENYMIEEAAVDENGEIIKDISPTGHKVTGKTLEWSIKAGETLEFPHYVADYLMATFAFLEVADKVEVKEEKKVEGSLVCKFCGRSFDKPRALSMHMGTSHTDELTSL